MKILVANLGSTSFKFRLFDMGESGEVMLAQEIKAGMQREMRQVEQYLLVTRIAIARATDQLAMAGDSP